MAEDVDAELDRIMAMSDEEILAQHLARYGGNKKLADKAIDMQKAKIQEIISRYWNQ